MCIKVKGCNKKSYDAEFFSLKDGQNFGDPMECILEYKSFTIYIWKWQQKNMGVK